MREGYTVSCTTKATTKRGCQQQKHFPEYPKFHSFRQPNLSLFVMISVSTYHVFQT